MSEKLGDYNHNDNPHALVGFLHNGKFYCGACIDHVHTDNDRHDYTKVYLINITPYKQSCCDCGRRVVQGKTPAWVELFD